MNAARRLLLRTAGAFAAGLFAPFVALAAGWNKDAFGAKTVAGALQGIGAANATPSSDVVIDAPEIAENGAVVPIEITATYPGPGRSPSSPRRIRSRWSPNSTFSRGPCPTSS